MRVGEQHGENSTATELVRTARTKRGISQRDLAAAARVPQSTVSAVESGHRQPSVAMLERLLRAAGFVLETRLTNIVRPSELLEKHYREVVDVIAGYPVTRAWVFGSVARGDDRPDSDLDLLVELTPGASVLDCVGLEDDLEMVLGCPVDVITTKELESNDLFERRVKRHRRQLAIAA
jgi:predicted nucleotidyltransferase/DNA-binding XRE family transcriptional regulator